MKNKHDTSESVEETKSEGTPVVRPSERAPGKFEAVSASGEVNPYAFRTEAEAWASLGFTPSE